jgi:predicted anti-sigma-YlaC factor YlaD
MSYGWAHPYVEELIAAYALDGIQDDDRAVAEREILEHLSGCSSCQQLFRDLRETSGDLALIAEPMAVPTEVQDRIMASVKGEKRPRAAARRPHGWARALVAAALVAIVALVAWNLQLSGSLRTQQTAARSARVALQVINDPAAAVHDLTPAGAEGHVALAITRAGRAVLVGTGLAELPSDKVLELWLMHSGVPARAAVFRPSDGLAIVQLTIDASRWDAVGITVENAPGAAAPTTGTIFASTLPA